MNFKKVAFGAVIAASLVLVSPASADPKKGDLLELTCDAPVNEVTITTSPGNGNWTPGHVVGSNMVLTPFAFTFAGTVHYKDETLNLPDEPFEESIVKKGPRNGRVVSCTFEQTYEDDYVEVEIIGTVTASYTR